MKEIKLNKGYVALVDDEDFERINKFKWQVVIRPGRICAQRHAKISEAKRGTKFYMHNEIMNPRKGFEVDHKDHNALNNQKENLRIGTHKDNQHNTRSHKDAVSKYKGVSFHKLGNKWQSHINKRYLGLFANEEDAAKAYDEAAKESYGEFAFLNFPI